MPRSATARSRQSAEYRCSLEAHALPEPSTLSGSISPTIHHPFRRHRCPGLTPGPSARSLNLPIFDGGRRRANVKSPSPSATGLSQLQADSSDRSRAGGKRPVGGPPRRPDGRRTSRRPGEDQAKTPELRTVPTRTAHLRCSTFSTPSAPVSPAQASLAAAVHQMAKDYVSLNIATSAGGVAPGGKTTAPAPRRLRPRADS